MFDTTHKKGDKMFRLKMDFKKFIGLGQTVNLQIRKKGGVYLPNLAILNQADLILLRFKPLAS